MLSVALMQYGLFEELHIFAVGDDDVECKHMPNYNGLFWFDQRAFSPKNTTKMHVCSASRQGSLCIFILYHNVEGTIE